ncbi:hypothetical protein PTKIN_Ptkin01aG0302900 [Pterospermum kingtungense]
MLPNLVYFKYYDFMQEDVSVVYMHSLVEADICILLDDAYELDIDDEEPHVQVEAVNQFLQAIGHVKLLRLFIDWPGLPLLSNKRFLPFINLVQLETFDDCWCWKGTGLFDFLESAPNVETIRLIHHCQFRDFGLTLKKFHLVCYITSRRLLLKMSF